MSMTRGRSAPFLVLLCLSLVAATLGMREFGLGAEDTYKHISGSGASLLDALTRTEFTGVSDDNKDERIIVSWQYTVAPSQHQNFVKSWKDIIEAGTKKEKGDQVLDLKKTAIDNLFFFSYGEWDSWQAFKDHLETAYFSKWVDYVKDHDIKWNFKWLEPVGEEKHKQAGLSKGKKTKNPWTVLSAIYIKPSAAADFVKAWNTAANGVEKEGGNLIYSLRRVASTNSEYWIYGAWESESDFQDHVKSDHVRKLTEHLTKKDIIAVVTPLIKLADQPE